MRLYIKPSTPWKWVFLFVLLAVWVASNAAAFELNEDGQSLIHEATQAYMSDLKGRPVVTDPQINGYAAKVVKKVQPKGKAAPPGVIPSITVVESPKPELYSYVDGHTVITTGMLYAMDNEAQLAGVLSPEMAQVVEGYYINMYQEIKAAERRERKKAAAGALFGALLDVAVDYAVEVEDIKQTERLWSGEATYGETLKRMAAVHAAQSAYYSIKDVINSIPVKDDEGNWIDPRFRFQAVADAQGMEYLALAGYDTSECAKGWENVVDINNRIAREKEQSLGPWASQLRQTEQLMEMNMRRLRQSLGASGLVQTISDTPPTRPEFVTKLVDLKEVREAQKAHGSKTSQSAYVSFIKGALLPRAEQALNEERYDQAYIEYQVLHNRGVRTAPVAYGLAKSKLGDFAFGASEAEKREAERGFKEALRLDSKYAQAYKGLAELYDDWERYEDAAQAYRNYLKAAPRSRDRRKIERKIKVLQRKASR